MIVVESSMAHDSPEWSDENLGMDDRAEGATAKKPSVEATSRASSTVSTVASTIDMMG